MLTEIFSKLDGDQIVGIAAIMVAIPFGTMMVLGIVWVAESTKRRIAEDWLQTRREMASHGYSVEDIERLVPYPDERANKIAYRNAKARSNSRSDVDGRAKPAGIAEI